ncbi:hypothetical protein [Phocoenobacter skyensis]|uniref:Uncharacterized protein n=1 Tax=Phocoenobacter skyensis TaxID=97481 RepID=A0A1H7XNB1_9PAST|nr:hypothetical protein [Pasteurella skyensis]MDP8080083.1 hypothetical protein [Pasteurella skyensis]MDP8086069.1 hypothetical protein [Pasteurella skyensis]MDP8185766.1 hypothetical protein [Pasteurella skyensis]QLB22653.1 hypothetical protein A6B44_05300 [Pasteurella skyensis]SEM35270.1 hypothetical protein SAMN05444853_11355 [Pasteurella skyensis]
MSMQSTMNFKIDPALKSDFLHACQSKGLSASLVIRELISGYCQENEPEPNIETLQAMKDAINSTNTTTMTAEEFFAWAEAESAKN